MVKKLFVWIFITKKKTIWNTDIRLWPWKRRTTTIQHKSHDCNTKFHIWHKTFQNTSSFKSTCSCSSCCSFSWSSNLIISILHICTVSIGLKMTLDSHCTWMLQPPRYWQASPAKYLGILSHHYFIFHVFKSFTTHPPPPLP